MRNRILYINPTGDLYGASRALLNLMKVIDLERYKPIVVVPEDGPLVDELLRGGIEVKVLTHMPVIRRQVMGTWRFLPFTASIFPFILYFWWFMRRHNVGIVHSNSGVIFVPACAAWLSGLPHVWHIREMFADEFGWLWRFYRTIILLLSSRVVCVSRSIAGQFSGHRKVQTIYDGIDLADFEVNPDSVCKYQEMFRSNYDGGSNNVKLIGIVSRISPRKGQDVLLQAAVILRNRGFRNVRFILVGDTFQGNEYLIDDLHKFVSDNELSEVVVLTGFISDPRPLIAGLDILVVPSILPEAFPGSVLEGMILKVPVVATDLGGTSEQIEHGVSGLLIPPADSVALADEIARILTDPILTQRLRSAGWNKVKTQFTLEPLHEQINSLYSQFLK